jgi:hypothetical protein
MTTLHSVMNDQPLIDRYHHSDLRRTRESQPWWHGSCYPPDRFDAESLRPEASISRTERGTVPDYRVPILSVDRLVTVVEDRAVVRDSPP